MQVISSLLFAGLAAAGPLAFPFPDNAGNGGNTPANSCDARHDIIPIPGSQFQVPIWDDCDNLAKKFRSGGFFKEAYPIKKQEHWSFGVCAFTVTIEPGKVAWLGREDAADLVNSATDDGKKDKGIVGAKGTLSVWTGESGKVPCESPDGGYVNVDFRIEHTQ